ncbi:MAG: argininosuccinate lyase [Candidatus Omnitrophica bacterium]|nr:argininosuccinate lyase [Candidatus Omnitrophota bacterium]HOX54869.1 argininosuccinate lyase [Candidatus Omnitrophota bacterium]
MKKLWGSRFAKNTSSLADQFSSSIAFDKRLSIHDVKGSIAHAKMLGKCGIISLKESQKIVGGLNAILEEILSGRFKFDTKAEDIHTNIQNALNKKIGLVADKLHTARSRNDQIALDMKMYTLAELKNLVTLTKDLQVSILKFAQKNNDVIIPAYTHLQPAQVVLLAHHLLAYLEMLQRDVERLNDTYKRTDVMPLGSCALSGTTLQTDRVFVTKELKFSQVTSNSIDSISDRDFVMETLSDLAILSVHLSRLAEDLILWSTKEFDFVEIDWSFCTGSSIMPHKKNPDILELIRGSVGKIQGDLSNVLIMMKGLPLSYNRDMQLDKPPLFNAVDTVKEILVIFAELFKNIKVNKTSIAKRIDDESLFSVDVMEYLIKKGVSYRQAHDTVGRMVRNCLDKGICISGLRLEELKKYSDKFSTDFKNLLNAKVSVSLKRSYGSTNPVLVKKQIENWKKRLNARF